MKEPIHHNSSHFEAISDAGLSPVQAQVIKALAQGQTVSAAAEKAGVHRTTIHHWIRNQPQFKAAVQTAQSEYAAEVNDSIHELAAHALLTLHDLLRDPATPACRPAENRARHPAAPACPQSRLESARPCGIGADRNQSRRNTNNRCDRARCAANPTARSGAGPNRSLRA